MRRRIVGTALRRYREELGITEYGADKRAQATLAVIANTRGAQGWWRAYADVMPDACLDYCALETAASRILIFSGQQVPDLLQTTEYATAVAEATSEVSPADVGQLVNLCLLRQEMVLTKTKPEVVVVIGEAALRQAVGGHEVLQAQLASLAGVSRKSPKVSIQVLPFACGGACCRGCQLVHGLALPPRTGPRLGPPARHFRRRVP
jgi:hypothetical protein